jgi:hypothetical protein
VIRIPCIILVGKILENSLVRPRGRRINFLKMGLGEISGKKWKWVELAEDLIV